jgi:transcriptional regulator with XRE-family HTH domain
MSNVDSPAVARRRVRLALRAFRTSKKLTQSQVAKAMDWSLSKVIRIEKGEVNVSPSDLKVLLEHLEVTDQAMVEELLEDVRLSRTERWTVSAEDRQHMTSAMLEMVQFEADATTIRYYNNLVVPGPLQTAQYATAIFALYPAEMDPEMVHARIALRERRRKRLLQSKDASYLVLLDQSVLQRTLGEPAALAEQLRLLLGLIEGKNIELRIAPFEGKFGLFFLGPFMLIDLEEGRSAMLYRETAGGDETVQTASEVARHRWHFDQMWQTALSPGASIELLKARLKELAEDGA